jgi:hypothetical protein
MSYKRCKEQRLYFSIVDAVSRYLNTIGMDKACHHYPELQKMTIVVTDEFFIVRLADINASSLSQVLSGIISLTPSSLFKKETGSPWFWYSLKGLTIEKQSS